LQQLNLINLHTMKKCCCAELYASQNTPSVNENGMGIVTFPYFTSTVFIHIKYTSNTAACYNNDIAEPRV